MSLRPEVPSGTVGERMRVATENDERDRNKSRDVCEVPSVTLSAHPPPPYTQSRDLETTR